MSETLLNEGVPDYDIPPNGYLKIQEKLIKPENIIQASAGFGYLNVNGRDDLGTLKRLAMLDYANIIKRTGKNPDIVFN